MSTEQKGSVRALIEQIAMALVDKPDQVSELGGILGIGTAALLLFLLLRWSRDGVSSSDWERVAAFALVSLLVWLLWEIVQRRR